MDLMKKHVDTIIILGGIVSSVLWMNGKFNDMDKRMSTLEKEMAVMKTVMFMNGHFPKELASNEGK